jgi:hypothetical protein
MEDSLFKELQEQIEARRKMVAAMTPEEREKHFAPYKTMFDRWQAEQDAMCEEEEEEEEEI